MTHGLRTTTACFALLAGVALLTACGDEVREDKAAEATPAPDLQTTATPPPEASPDASEPVTPQIPPYTLETLVPGAPFHGIHGLTFDAEGRLLVGSVVGSAIYEVDPETGASSVFIPPPHGMADDIEQGPDGTLVWTAFSEGKVYALTPAGELRLLADGYPGANSLAFATDGRVFFTQVFAGDALYELDLSGESEPRKIMEGMGGLNGFDFGPDGKLYGPLWFKGQVVRVDVDAATLETVAEGFQIPAAVNFNSKGELYAVDTARGEVVRVDIETGERTVIATVPTAIDNLAFSADDRLFLTIMADNAVWEVNTETGETREVISYPLATPVDIALVDKDGRETLYVSDIFSLRKVDVETGAVSDVLRMWSDELDYPLWIGASDDALVLTSFASLSAQRIDLATEESAGLHHGFGAIADTVPDGGGILFLDFLGGALVRASGEDLATREEIAGGLAGPVGLVRMDETTVYVTESVSGALSRIDLATGARTEIAAGLDLPEGFDLDTDGSIVLAEVGAQRIVRIDPETGSITPIAGDLPMGLPGASNAPPVNLLTGVAVAESGDIFFSSDIDAAIYRLRKAE